MVKVRFKVRFRVQKNSGLGLWRHSNRFIWDTYRRLSDVPLTSGADWLRRALRARKPGRWLGHGECTHMKSYIGTSSDLPRPHSGRLPHAIGFLSPHRCALVRALPCLSLIVPVEKRLSRRHQRARYHPASASLRRSARARQGEGYKFKFIPPRKRATYAIRMWLVFKPALKIN